MAGEAVGTNLPTYTLNATSVTARAAEIAAGAPAFAGGCNLSGSCAGVIGINTGNPDPAVQDWSTLDQDGAAREPQDSQHIGGDGLGDGDQSTTAVQIVEGGDINNTASFSVADANAAVDAVYDTGSGALNKTGAAVVIGDRVWGPIPVA